MHSFIKLQKSMDPEGEVKSVPKWMGGNGPGPSLKNRVKDGRTAITAQVRLTPDCPEETIKELLQNGWAVVVAEAARIGTEPPSEEDCELTGSDFEQYFVNQSDQ